LSVRSPTGIYGGGRQETEKGFPTITLLTAVMAIAVAAFTYSINPDDPDGTFKPMPRVSKVRSQTY
jgi:hypothetical protein